MGHDSSCPTRHITTFSIKFIRATVALRVHLVEYYNSRPDLHEVGRSPFHKGLAYARVVALFEISLAYLLYGTSQPVTVSFSDFLSPSLISSLTDPRYFSGGAGYRPQV